MKNLLVADIGGTNTRLHLADINGNILHSSSTFGVAASTESASPLPCLEKLLEELHERENIGAIAINLGGKNTGQVEGCFRKYFPQTPMKIFRESEGTAAYALSEEYGAPIVLMAGTGTIAVGKAENGFVISGGWGMNVGDDGSGYDIGLQAIRKSFRALDGTEPLSPLVKYLCGVEEPLCATQTSALYRDARDTSRERFYPLERKRIAALTKTVAEFAEKGDKTALEIFSYAGEKLAELVLCTAKKLDGEIPAIVITGGLINCRKFWQEPFEYALHNALPDVKTIYIFDGLLKGSLKVAADLYKGEQNK